MREDTLLFIKEALYLLTHGYKFALAAKIRHRGAKKISPCLKFPPQICQAKWPAHAQPIGPNGTCITQLSSINFAPPCNLIYMWSRAIRSYQVNTA